MAKLPDGKKQKVWLASLATMAFHGRVNVFTYGSLMFDEVWRGVTGRLAESVPGVLADHAAWRLRGQNFPGLAPAPGHQTAGRIWLAVTPDELARLDEFESGLYERRLFDVRAGNGRRLNCWAYEVRSDSRSLLEPALWDPEEFRQRHLAGFLSGT